jgi:hypothetical protein
MSASDADRGSSSRTLTHRPKPTTTLPIRTDLAESLPMTAEQRTRAIDAMATLLIALWNAEPETPQPDQPATRQPAR